MHTSWPAYVTAELLAPGRMQAFMSTGEVLLLLRAETGAKPDARPIIGYSTYPTRAAWQETSHHGLAKLVDSGRKYGPRAETIAELDAMINAPHSIIAEKPSCF